MASVVFPLFSRGIQVLHQHVLSNIPKRCLSLQPLSRCAAISNYPTRTHFSGFGPLTVGSVQHSRQFTALHCGLSNTLLLRTLQHAPRFHMQVRTVTMFSKKGKRKTVKAVAKRFIRTGSGKLKYWPAGKVHNMLAKSRKKRRQLRKAKYVNKTIHKTLNKMISGW